MAGMTAHEEVSSEVMFNVMACILRGRDPDFARDTQRIKRKIEELDMAIERIGKEFMLIWESGAYNESIGDNKFAEVYEESIRAVLLARNFLACFIGEPEKHFGKPKPTISLQSLSRA
jgi:hypothetical protein